MSCSFKQSDQLVCNTPDNASPIDHLAVYFKSDSGEETIVARCSQVDAFECTVEDGFSCFLSDSQHAEIGLPERFFQKSGTFRCQISGLAKSDIQRCPWPTDVEYNSENIKFNTSFGSHGLQTHTDAPGTEANFPSAAVIGAVIGATISIIILVLVLYVLWKRKHQRVLFCLDEEKSYKSGLPISPATPTTTEPVDMENSCEQDGSSRPFLSKS